MKFHLKLFITMALTIVTIGIVFIALTRVVVTKAIESVIHETRGKEMEMLDEKLSNYYVQNSGSWKRIEEVDLLVGIAQDEPAVLIKNSVEEVITIQGDVFEKMITRLGVKQEVVIQGQRAGWIYYYDPEVAFSNKLMLGIPIAVTFVLTGSGLLLTLISLFIAYLLSRWLASPLKALLPLIERIGAGELGAQAQVHVKDEYGKIADALNGMSSKLEHAEKQRRNLTADIAHELRTPLTIIGGKLDELQHHGQPVPPETLLPLQDELIRLNRLVEDVGTLSLAEAGKLTLQKSETDMAELARRILLVVEPLAEEKEIALQLEVSTERTSLPADSNRIKQVLINLLTNAIRYTPHRGMITVRLREERKQWLTIEVEDTGIGIALEHLPYLFDRFYRTDEARTRESGGTGLGLAIAKQFVVAHLGTIEAESELNQGTRFIVRLPY
ncbi:sensor histidine kinase [Paenibacillus sp. GCM10027627]|uniref:sensor histidine kinase n=1 Tax=unclassified Paenibacillus TaxID=185978 RepID=UPI003629D55B